MSNSARPYISPDLTTIEVVVSSGFATSPQTPDFNEDGPDIVLP